MARMLVYCERRRVEAVKLLVRRADVFHVFWHYMSIHIGASKRLHPLSMVLHRADKQRTLARWLYRMFATKNALC